MSENALSYGGHCTYLTASGSCNPGETVVWDLGALQSGSGITVVLPPIVAGSAADGAGIAFEARALEGAALSAQASHTVMVEAGAALELKLDEDADPVGAGEELRYVLSYGNRGAVSATGAELRLPLPPGVSLVSASGAYVVDGSNLVWDLDLLTAGSGGRQEVVVELDGGLTEGTLLEVDAATLSGQIDFAQVRTRATAVTRVAAAAPLGLTLVVNPDPVRPGEVLQTQLTVTNLSSVALADVSLELFYPEHINRLSENAVSDGGSCTYLTASGACDTRETVVWTLGTLPPNSGRTVSLPPTVAAGMADGTLIGFAAEAFEGGLGSVRTAHTVMVEAGAALELELDEDADPVGAGEELRYVLTYGNRGAVSAMGTELRLPLPPGVSLVSASGGGVLDGSDLVWDLGLLTAGGGGRREVVVQLDGGLADGTQLRIDAATLSGQIDFAQVRTRATAVTRVAAAAPLGLTLVVNPDPVRPGEVLRTQLTVTNLSGAALADVSLELFYPEHLNRLHENAISDGGSCTYLTASGWCDVRETVAWTLGTLPPNGERMVSLQPTVTAGTADGTLLGFDGRALVAGRPGIRAVTAVLVHPYEDLNDNGKPDVYEPPPQPSVVSLDIDDNGAADALTDGLLVLRYLFGLRGDTLIRDAVVADAGRASAAEIEAYLDSIRASLDVDGNDKPDALTDGLLILRYLFGLGGNALIQDAVATDATRITAAAISDYIEEDLLYTARSQR